MLHIAALCSIEPDLLPIKVLHCGNSFCSCDLDLDLDPMTFVFELDPYPLKVYPRTKSELPRSGLSKVVVLHTDMLLHC